MSGSAALTRIHADDGVSLQNLAADLAEHLAVHAVIGGVTPGMIYVDDPNHPRAMLVQAHHRFYLAGDAGIPEFNHGLHDLFANEIYPRSLAEGKEAVGLIGW